MDLKNNASFYAIAAFSEEHLACIGGLPANGSSSSGKLK